MENPQNKWRFIAGKVIYFYAIYTMAMLVITRGYTENPLPKIETPPSRNPVDHRMGSTTVSANCFDDVLARLAAW